MPSNSAWMIAAAQSPHTDPSTPPIAKPAKNKTTTTSAPTSRIARVAFGSIIRSAITLTVLIDNAIACTPIGRRSGRAPSQVAPSRSDKSQGQFKSYTSAPA